MFAFMGLGPQEFVLLVAIAVAMVVGPVVAAVLGLVMLRWRYHIGPGELVAR